MGLFSPYLRAIDGFFSNSSIYTLIPNTGLSSADDFVPAPLHESYFKDPVPDSVTVDKDGNEIKLFLVSQSDDYVPEPKLMVPNMEIIVDADGNKIWTPPDSSDDYVPAPLHESYFKDPVPDSVTVDKDGNEIKLFLVSQSDDSESGIEVAPSFGDNSIPLDLSDFLGCMIPGMFMGSDVWFDLDTTGILPEDIAPATMVPDIHFYADNSGMTGTPSTFMVPDMHIYI